MQQLSIGGKNIEVKKIKEQRKRKDKKEALEDFFKNVGKSSDGVMVAGVEGDPLSDDCDDQLDPEVEVDSSNHAVEGYPILLQLTSPAEPDTKPPRSEKYLAQPLFWTKQSLQDTARRASSSTMTRTCGTQTRRVFPDSCRPSSTSTPRCSLIIPIEELTASKADWKWSAIAVPSATEMGPVAPTAHGQGGLVPENISLGYTHTDMGIQQHPCHGGGIVPSSYGNQNVQAAHPGTNPAAVDPLRQMQPRPSGYVHQQAPGSQNAHNMQNTPRFDGLGHMGGQGFDPGIRPNQMLAGQQQQVIRTTFADATKLKKPRGLSKILRDQKRGKTRLNIGLASRPWRALRKMMGATSDSDLAYFLLDSYEHDLTNSTPWRPNPPDLPISVQTSKLRALHLMRICLKKTQQLIEENVSAAEAEVEGVVQAVKSEEEEAWSSKEETEDEDKDLMDEEVDDSEEAVEYKDVEAEDWVEVAVQEAMEEMD